MLIFGLSCRLMTALYMERKHRFLIAAGTILTLAVASEINVKRPEQSEACPPSISASKEETESLSLERQNVLRALDWLEHSKSEKLRCSAQDLGPYKTAILERDTSLALFLNSGILAQKNYTSVAFEGKEAEAVIMLSKPMLSNEDFDVVEAAKSFFNSYTTLNLIKNDQKLYFMNEEYRMKIDTIALSQTQEAFNQAQ